MHSLKFISIEKLTRYRCATTSILKTLIVSILTTTSLASIAMPLLGAVPNGTATNKSGPIILFSQKSCLPDGNKC